MPPIQLYRVNTAAAILALRPSTVRKLISRRSIAVVRPTPGAVRISESEIIRIQREGLSPRQNEAPMEGSEGSIRCDFRREDE